MIKKIFGIFLVMAMGMSLLVGCGESENDNKESSLDTNAVQDTEADAENVESAIAIITDVYTGESIRVSYNTAYCEEQENGDFLLSVVVEDGEWFDIEFYADYTADDYYQEQVNGFESMLEATELESYENAGKTVYGFAFYENSSDEKYSQQLMFEVDGGVLIVHNSNLDMSNEENAKVFVDKIFLSAEKPIVENETNTETDADTNENDNKIALTNEDKATVYNADYEAIKDKIANEERDGNEASYYDANGLEIMYVYYDGENITDVFFKEYTDNGTKKYQKVYAFHEDGTYGIMEFEYHENGETKTETVYNDDGSKLVFSFDESGDYVSGTEYDKDGNVVE